MEKENLQKQVGSDKVSQVEDRVLKTAAQFFGEDLLPYLGVQGEIDRVAPTEHVHLEMRRLEEDFNFIMKDGSWRHLEFESDSIKEADLRRFREYEAYIGMVFNVPVVTTVLCTSKARIHQTELVNGSSIYRVELVRLKDWDASAVLENLDQTLKEGRKLKRQDVFPILLIPLMSGEMEMGERICRGMDILQSQELEVGRNDVKRMQSVLYALAVKLLKTDTLEQVKERIGMTVLGQMLWDMGIEEGIEKGIEQGIEKGIEQGIEKGRKEGVEEGIQALILDNLEEGVSKERIIEKLSRRFSLDETAALAFYEKYKPKEE